MSRTDKTDPYWVKTARHGVPVHDHRNGPCDLGRPDPVSSPGRCTVGEDWHAPLFRCPCRMCHNGFEDPRAQRRDGRRQVRDWAAED